jgi:hypothetical protein
MTQYRGLLDWDWYSIACRRDDAIALALLFSSKQCHIGIINSRFDLSILLLDLSGK